MWANPLAKKMSTALSIYVLCVLTVPRSTALYEPVRFVNKAIEASLLPTHALIHHRGPQYIIRVRGEVKDTWKDCKTNSNCRGELTVIVYDGGQVVATNDTRYDHHGGASGIQFKPGVAVVGSFDRLGPTLFEIDMQVALKRQFKRSGYEANSGSFFCFSCCSAIYFHARFRS